MSEDAPMPVCLGCKHPFDPVTGKVPPHVRDIFIDETSGIRCEKCWTAYIMAPVV
jgi:hypothetical protein